MQYAVCIYQSVRGNRQTKADPVNKLALISSRSCPALAAKLVDRLQQTKGCLKVPRSADIDGPVSD